MHGDRAQKQEYVQPEFAGCSARHDFAPSY
jgi:hypothetical protein